MTAQNEISPNVEMVSPNLDAIPECDVIVKPEVLPEAAEKLNQLPSEPPKRPENTYKRTKQSDEGIGSSEVQSDPPANAEVAIRRNESQKTSQTAIVDSDFAIGDQETPKVKNKNSAIEVKYSVDKKAKEKQKIDNEPATDVPSSEDQAPDSSIKHEGISSKTAMAPNKEPEG